MKLKEFVIAVLLLGVITSGCLTMTIDSKVDGNGDLQNYKIVLTTNSFVYGLLTSELSEDDMTLREQVESEGGTYSEEWNEDEDEVSIIIENIDSESTDIQVEGEYIIFRDEFTDFPNQASEFEDEEMDQLMNGAIKIHYYLEMPGKIVDSNANEVNGNKAEWHIMDLRSAKPVYAKSEKSTLPGFGAVESLFAVFLSLYIIRRTQ